MAKKYSYTDEGPQPSSHGGNWRNINISDRVYAMKLGQSGLSVDPRSDKELLAEALKEKYV